MNPSGQAQKTTADAEPRSDEMVIRRASCPDCELIHVVAVPADAARAPYARCERCAREWAISDEDLFVDTSSRCGEHPGRRARWFCQRCESGYCAACMPPRLVQGVPVRLSRCCDAQGFPLAETFEVEALWKRPLQLLAYPLHRRGWPVFAAVLIGLHIPVISWLVVLLLFGYLAHVLVRSARGEQHLPEFPDFTDAWDSVFFPMGRLLLTGWWAFAPLWFYARWQGHDWSDPIIPVLWAFATLFTPMVVMLGSLSQSVLTALNPLNVVRFMVAIASEYLTAVALIVILWGTYLVLRAPLTAFALGSLLRPIVDLYVLFLSFHILGRTAYLTRDRAVWGV